MGAGELDPKEAESEKDAIPLRPSLFPKVPPYILFTPLSQKFDSTFRNNENIEVDGLDGHGMSWHVRRSGLVWPVVLQTARQAGYTVREVGIKHHLSIILCQASYVNQNIPFLDYCA